MTNMDDVLTVAADGKWIALGAVIIGAIVRVLKLDKESLPTVPPQWRPWLALGLGLVAGVLQAVLGGATWQKALSDGLASALAAIAGHDLLIESLRGGRELGSGAATPAAETVSPSLKRGML